MTFKDAAKHFTVHGLVQQLRDPDPFNRMSAAAALGQLSKLVFDSIPALIAASRDANERVAMTAQSALRDIRDAVPSQRYKTGCR